MSRIDRVVSASAVIAVALAVAGAGAIQEAPPTNDLPNPYKTVENYFKLPSGRSWGATSAVDIDKDGRSIWVGERCGANSCLDAPTVDTVLKFDASGKLVKSFGAGLIIWPHGMFVDRDGNVWVTDGQDNAPRGERGRGESGGGREAALPPGPPPGPTKGHQVFKFSPDGKVLMTLGRAGGAVEPDCCFQPNDVLVAPNGDIFVAVGHGAPVDRILKFSSDG